MVLPTWTSSAVRALLYFSDPILASAHPEISPAEKGALASDTLKTIIIDNYSPYTFVNTQGQPAGFSVDLMQAVAQTMGIQVAIRVDTWDHALEALQNGGIDFFADDGFLQRAC